LLGLSLLAFLAAGCADAPLPEAPPSDVLPSEAVPAETPPEDAAARALVDRAIAAHGGDVLEHAEVALAFRGTPYLLRRDGGRFAYVRTATDSLGRRAEDV